jgi:myosin V
VHTDSGAPAGPGGRQVGDAFTFEAAHPSLLSIARLIWRKKDESNFRVFSLLVQGAKESVLNACFLHNDVSAYKMLQGGCLTSSQAKDEFEQLSMSMILMGFPSKVQLFIWSVLAAVLHLGNVRFSYATQYENKVLYDDDAASGKALKTAAELLGVDAQVRSVCNTVLGTTCKSVGDRC